MGQNAKNVTFNKRLGNSVNIVYVFMYERVCA